MIGSAPNLAKACEVRYEEIYKYTNLYQHIWDETKYPDEDMVKDNAEEIGDVLAHLFYIADAPFTNADMAVEQLANVKNLLIAFRTEYCERETEKRAYPK